jgi:hypothetical protein
MDAIARSEPALRVFSFLVDNAGDDAGKSRLCLNE